jgi:hypothetical protein
MVVSTRKMKQNVLNWVFKEILDLEEGSTLHKACEHERIYCMDALITLTPLEIADFGNNQGIIRGLQCLFYNRALALDPIAKDWSNLSKEQFDNYCTSPEFQAIFPHEPEPVPTICIVPSLITMITPLEQATILNHVLQNVLEEDPGSLLAIAIDQHGCQSIQDVMDLSPWEIESLKLKDGSTLPRSPRILLVTFQAFVLSLYPNPDALVTEEWMSLSSEELTNFRRSPEWILLRQQSPRPVPPHDDTTNGEQYKNWGAPGVIELFDVEEFQAAMVQACETFSCLEEEESEDTTTDDNNSIEILNDAIEFFEYFWLEDDIKLHSLLDEPTNVPSEEYEFVPSNNKPSPTNKEAHEPNHSPTMEDNGIYIEYPDRTKFVSSMNHKRYEKPSEDWYANY